MTAHAEFAEGSNESFCSLGAINEVTTSLNVQRAAKKALHDYLRNNGVLKKNIPSWNDSEETTLDDVREAFLMTAKDLRNREE